MTDSDTEFWKESDGEVPIDINLANTGTSHDGSGASLGPINEDESNVSKSSDGEIITLKPLTPPPLRGFPRVHADCPLWFLEDMRSEQSCQWLALIRSALAVVPYGFSASNIAFRPAIMAIVPHVVNQYFDVENPHLAPPLATSDICRPNQLPLAYLLYNLSAPTHEALLRHYCIFTNELTFFIYDLAWEIPRYICTLNGFTSSDRDELHDVIVERLSSNASIQVLIDIFDGEEDAVAHAFAIINSLKVAVLDLHRPSRYPAPAVNLYMNAPTNNLEHWVTWRNRIY
ncbi:hypothetical protein BKA93DRAFT_828898 [Sparassis latifolia]